MRAGNADDALDLDDLNRAPREDARRILLGCCASRHWADRLTAGRPYPSEDDLFAAADAALAELTEDEVDEALAGHPRIGDRAPLPADWSRREQSGMDSADAQTAAALAQGNRDYEAMFGHVYLVSASGRSAQEMLRLLHERLGNDPRTERAVLRSELRQINRLRLARLVGSDQEVSG